MIIPNICSFFKNEIGSIHIRIIKKSEIRR
nr:MAG TPA: hypothetical protein [Caudoviricetes sp.]